MTNTINSSAIGNVKQFISRNKDKAEYVATGEYRHFYVIVAEGFAMAISRSKYADDGIQAMFWMSDDRASEVREIIISESK